MGGMLSGGLGRQRRRAGGRLRSGLSPAASAACGSGGRCLGSAGCSCRGSGKAMCFARKILYFPRGMG